MAQKQHYVPQSLLKRFCGSDGQLFVYDKWDRRTFRSSPRRVAVEGGFYDLGAPDGSTVSLEPSLGNLESRAGACIEKILAREEIGFLTDAERRVLSEFAAVQFIRVRNFRERFKDMSEKLVEKLRRSAPPHISTRDLPTPADDDAAKFTSLKMIIDARRQFAPLFYSKTWLLLMAPDDRSYWISDNPITLHNSVPPPAPFMSNLGLAVRGIEIYLPISASATLNFLCPTMAEKILDSNRDAVHLVHGLGAQVASAEQIGYMADAVRYGYPVPSKSENIDFANSLQVSNAERFIFSKSDDFALADQMLDDHPHLGEGPRMGMS